MSHTFNEQWPICKGKLFWDNQKNSLFYRVGKTFFIWKIEFLMLMYTYLLSEPDNSKKHHNAKGTKPFVYYSIWKIWKKVILNRV